jgi:hypothetical protein
VVEEEVEVCVLFVVERVEEFGGPINRISKA